MGWSRIVLGIGNPGPEYDDTRHNAGFMVLDELARRVGTPFSKLERRGPDGKKRFSGKVKAKVSEATITDSEGASQTILLVKPMTYVNLSGEVAAPLLRHCELPPESLFVVVDDLNLPLGRTRIRPSGSAGGHNGLKSIQAMLGSDAYPRLRLGIGPPASSDGGSEGPSPDRAAEVHAAEWRDFVLAPFLPEEREVLGRVVGWSADCAEAWLAGADPKHLMGTYNGVLTGRWAEPPSQTDPTSDPDGSADR